MTLNVDFERQLLALDREKLLYFLEGTILMYVEYIEVHGHEADVARIAAIDEMISGSEAMIELFEQGEL